MHKHVLSILSASLVVATLTTSHAQTRPRQTTTRPAVKVPSTPTHQPDLLVRQDGTQLEVLVTEITDKEIVYKRASNPNGPLFRSQKADFSYLKYGTNGEIEQFAKVVQPAPAQPTPTAVQPAPTPVQPAPARSTSYTPAPASQPRQVDMPQGFRFGFKGGIQSTSLSLSPSYIPTSSIVGFQAGLLADRPLGKSVRVRTQLLYSSKGAKRTDFNISYNYNYIEVPVDVLFKIPTSSGQLLLGGGGYFGYALNGKTGPYDAKIGNAQTDDLTTTDLGVRVSGWYDLSSGLTLNVFYNLGLVNINPTIYFDEPTVKNRTFGLGIGYFLFKK